MSAALVHFIWQGTVLGCLLWLALHAMRRRSPNARYVVSCLALLLMALAPIVTTIVMQTRPAPVRATISALRATGSMHIVSARPDAIRWVLPVWCAGVLFFSLRLLWGCAQVAGLQRRAEQPCQSLATTVVSLARRIGLNHLVDVRITRVVQSPGVIGLLRPVVLVPAATIAGLTPEQLEAVLAHELAHIRRYDHLVNAAQVVIETLLFYHPCVWWASARIRRERELCCDDLAVRACGDAVCYARALTRLERLRLASPRLAMGSTGGPLLYRIQRLLGAAGQECVPSKLPVVFGMSFAVACLMFYLSDGRAQTKPEPPAPAPPVVEQVEQPAEVRAAPKKHSEPRCTERDLRKAEYWHELQQERAALETRWGHLRDQVSFYSAMSKPPEANAVRSRLIELNRALIQIEALLAQLRETYRDDHPDVQAVKDQLRSLKTNRDQLEREEMANAERALKIEKSVENLEPEIAAVEAAIRSHERTIEEATARLTARQKACLAR
jgi:beta-lactamase regulating signal transducer with metallopeptidase domain